MLIVLIGIYHHHHHTAFSTWASETTREGGGYEGRAIEVKEADRLKRTELLIDFAWANIGIYNWGMRVCYRSNYIFGKITYTPVRSIPVAKAHYRLNRKCFLFHFKNIVLFFYEKSTRHACSARNSAPSAIVTYKKCFRCEVTWTQRTFYEQNQYAHRHRHR